MTLDDLTVNFEYLDRDALLSDWAWLIGENKLPILLSASGDAFIQDITTGSIYVLDTAIAELIEVADSTEQFRQLLTEKDFVVDFMGVEMVGDLIRNNVTLNKGQIYSYKKPPVLGGDYVLENVEPTDIGVHFSLTGQIHKQVKDLPEGTAINDIKLV